MELTATWLRLQFEAPSTHSLPSAEHSLHLQACAFLVTQVHENKMHTKSIKDEVPGARGIRMPRESRHRERYQLQQSDAQW